MTVLLEEKVINVWFYSAVDVLKSLFIEVKTRFAI